MASTGGLVGMAHRDGMGQQPRASTWHPYSKYTFNQKKKVLTIGGVW